MTLQQLRSRVEQGEIDTVLVAAPDVFGRLVGKRFTAPFFLQSIAEHGTHGCNYLLTVNIEMEPMDGFKLASWDAGFGDFQMAPDLNTIRILPWQQSSALVICDLLHHDGKLVKEAPRSVLKSQIEALAATGYFCNIASELEFYLYNQTYEAAFQDGYRDLKPSSDYRIDYHLLQPTRDEPLFRAMRNMMGVAGVPVESSKGEWGRGQHEVNFIYSEPMPMGDMHVVFKHGAKEITSQMGKSITFMAKPIASDAGNSCHIHCSIWKGNQNLFWNHDKKTPSKMFRQFLGGLMKYTPELGYFFAPTINSYKRYQAANWAPTRMAWSHDNRTVGFRIVGQGNSFRIENRMPGADANPYLAFAATILAGMAGVREDLDCGADYKGNAYLDETLARLPASLHDAAELLHKSKLARSTLGDEVVDYYVHTARLEVAAFNSAVTDWERVRYFERI